MEKRLDKELILDYEPLYYDPTSCPEEYKSNFPNIKEWSKEGYEQLLKSCLNISKLNATNFRAEKEVMKKLKKTEFDAIALAWKAGKIDWKDNQLITTNFETDDYYINGYGGQIRKTDFNNYCDKLENMKDCINNYVDEEKWQEAYKAIMEISPKNIGPVYNINTLFFLTGGKAPIYDAFAHKAVKGLLLNIAPSEVYLGSNPDKKDVVNITAMYQEYMILLKMVFKDWFKQKKKEDLFIPRKLDRALWVYGHSTTRRNSR